MRKKIQITIEIPELRGLILLGNRVMQYIEDRQRVQSEIDALTARVRGISAKLKLTIQEEA